MKSLAKRCGSCTLCCLKTAVPEIGKPVNFWCAFCDAVTGCKIYSSRPESCKKYFCLWYVNPQMPITLRPDMCGVIFEKLVDGHTYLALIDPKWEDAWKEVPVLEVMSQLNKQGFSVVAFSGPGKPVNMSLGKGHTEKHVRADIAHAVNMATDQIRKQNDSTTLRN